MKVSIITAVYNNSDTIIDTIESVLSQDYPLIEHIIVDGASTDGTLDLLGGYHEYLDKVISEQDNGIYDALNKGIREATGDVIGILHADDMFYSPTVVSDIIKAFTNPEVSCTYGDLIFIDRENKNNVVRTWKAGSLKPKAFEYGWMPPHPTFFVKKDCYEQLGHYDTDLKTAADYELMLRYLHKNKLPSAYIEKPLVKMRIGGASTKNLKNRLKANREDKLAWKKNNLKPKPYTRLLKPLRKIHQFSFVHYAQKYLVPLLVMLCFFLGIADKGTISYFDYLLVPFFAWGVAIISIPAIRSVALAKNLVDNPNSRSSHKAPIPTMGGVAVFSASIISICLWGNMNAVSGLPAIIAAGLIIFFTGIKDDMLILDPKKKFMGQLMAVILVVFNADLHMDYFFGIMGIYDLHPWIGYIFTIFTLLVAVNAYNLIDGIDGLASGTGAVAAITFGIWFTLADYGSYAIFAFALAGSLIGFMKFNFSKSQKIFLGDAGSMFIGLIIGVLAIKFITSNELPPKSIIYIKNAPFVAIAVMGIPLFDLLRVMMIRIIKKQSPFFPDKNHIHHILLSHKLSHLQATLILIAIQAILSGTMFLFFAQVQPNSALLVAIGIYVFYFLGCKALYKQPVLVKQKM
ncbi:MAG: glycosyltransferase [Bacteroidota bacterium]